MLYGRDRELARLTGLITEARRDRRSGSLVLRGETGIGKTALLDRAAEEASGMTAPPDRAADEVPGMTVLRVTGVEAERDLAFAGLLQLLWPTQDRLEVLPEPQAAALRAVFGTAEARDQDRFLTGLAVLTLLADLADDGPVLCLVDDAHWLDRPTADALLFAARRLTAEGIVLLFATREDGLTGHGLPELELPRLDRADAARLLDRFGLTPGRRDRIIAEAAGNPLALIEFGSNSREHMGGPAPLPVADRVVASFRAQIAGLPERTRLMMLIAAAEGRGHLPTLLGAANALGVGLDDLEAAEQAGLLEVTQRSITFRHPLIRSAAYQGASLARRLTVHRALAEASEDASCRIRHQAATAMAPSEDIAAGLEAAAERARDRAGGTAAIGLYRQAARLSPDPRMRGRRLGAAADAAVRAGGAGEAHTLLEEAEGLIGDPAELALLAPVRAAVEFERGEPREAARVLIERSAAAGPDGAAAMLRAGASYAWLSGDEGSVRAAAERLRAFGHRDPSVEGMARLVDDDFAGGLPLLAGVVGGALRGLRGEAPAPRPDDLANAIDCALIIGADDAALELAAAEVARCRRLGLVGELPKALQKIAQAQAASGSFRDAEAAVAEAVAVARDTGRPQRIGRLNTVLARIAAIRGEEERCAALLHEIGGDAERAPADCALSLLDLGLGRYDAALGRLEKAQLGPGRYTTAMISGCADQVEAAVRAGLPERAEAPLRRFEAWAEAGGQAWARAVALRCRALLHDDGDRYEQAVRLHAEGGRPFEHARTGLLYGEWLRRARRRTDARGPLRSALEIFERLQAAPWAERARAELRATGETGATARPTAPDPLERLTPQELQVVRLAAEGTSSREIAAQLFLSPRTVEYHLYKAYPKLGVSSRRELAALLRSGRS